MNPDNSQELANTSPNSLQLEGSSATEIDMLRKAMTSAVIATQAILRGSTGPFAPFSDTTNSVYEFNEHQTQVRQLYLKLLEGFGSLARFELQPGDRHEALGFLSNESSSNPDIFLEAFERIFYTESKKISDRAKASALRFCSDFSYPSNKSKWVSFLINQLRSSSPSQASSAAMGLAEMADGFSVPALTAAKSLVRWPSVRADLEETIGEISSQ